MSTFLLLIAGVAVLTNWMINRVRLHARQVDVAAKLANRDVIDLISRLPDHASYRGPRGHFVNVSAASGWEKHLAALLGMPYEADVKALSVSGPVEDWDELFTLIKRLPKLANLGFMRCEIGGDVLSHLAKLRVESISFSDTNLTKQQARMLKKELPDTSITIYDEQLAIRFELP
ncbi:MAG: hypothetical protein WD894_17260 [Pirellulales bacterium]